MSCHGGARRSELTSFGLNSGARPFVWRSVLAIAPTDPNLQDAMLPDVDVRGANADRNSLARWQYLAPRAGFEPATNRLTAGCSTTELPGNAPQRDARL